MNAAAPARAPQRPRAEPPSLRLVVARPLVAGRAAFAGIVATVLAVGLVLLLLLHTWAAQDAFRLQEIQRQAATLDDSVQQLALQEQQREDPGVLAARARALGMMPTTSLAFVRLHRHGRIVGVARAAPLPVPTHPPAAPAHTDRHAKPAAGSDSTAKASATASAGKKTAKPATGEAKRTSARRAITAARP